MATETKKITATVSYPVSVEVEVPIDADEDQMREKVLDAADNGLQSYSVKPVIIASSEPELEE